MTAYDNLGKVLERHAGKDGIARLRTGAGLGSSAHVREDDDGTRIVSVRGNVVVRARRDGTTELDTCGWHTLTTSYALRLAVGASSFKGDYWLGKQRFNREGSRETLTIKEGTDDE